MTTRGFIYKLTLLIIVSIIGFTLVPGCGVAGPSTTGGILKISTREDPLTMGNPATQRYQSGLNWSDIGIERLFRFDEAATLIPWLATGYKIDQNLKTITLNIRKGVKFHDGTDFNAQAVKWNLEKCIAAKRGELAAVASMDVIDDYTLRLNLSKMDSLLIFNLGMVPGLMISPTAYEKSGTTEKERTDWAEKNPVSTSPYQFVSWERTVKITYKKYPNYWQKDKPYLDGVQFTTIADPMVDVANFKKGDADVMANPTILNGRDLMAEGKYNVTKSTGGTWVLFPDSVNKDSPFANVKVRQAAWHAIDAKSICKSIFFDFCVPMNQGEVPGNWANNPDVKGYSYDPAKAKQLMAEAGYPNGFKTTLYAVTFDSDPAAAIQANLKTIGIEAEIQLVDHPRRIQMLTGGGWKGLWLTQFGLYPAPAGLQRTFAKEVHATRAASVDVPTEYEDLIDKIVVAPDFDTMKKLVADLQKIGTDKYCMVIYPWSWGSAVAKQKYVQNDGIGKFIGGVWTPDSIWLDKK